MNITYSKKSKIYVPGDFTDPESDNDIHEESKLYVSKENIVTKKNKIYVPGDFTDPESDNEDIKDIHEEIKLYVSQVDTVTKENLNFIKNKLAIKFSINYPTSSNILFPSLTEKELEKVITDINLNKQKKKNYLNLINDIINLDKDETHVNSFMSYKIRSLLYTNPDTKIFFEEFLNYNIQIWILIYNNYCKNSLPKFEYVRQKDISVTHTFTYKQDTNKDIMTLFVNLRNYQLMIINTIYNAIELFYDENKNKKITDLEVEYFKTELTKKINIIKKTAEKYTDKIKEHSKLKYQYENFESYITNIYMKIICERIKQLEKYSMYNKFVVNYIRNYLLINNEIFYRGELDKTNYDLTKLNKEEAQIYLNEIDRVNEIIKNIKNFINNLEENKILNELNKILLAKLIEKNNTNFEKELKKMFFLANLYVDYAVKKIWNPHTTFESPIIESPALVLETHKFFCPLIKKKLFNYNLDVKASTKIKIIGIRNTYTEFIDTCPSEIEASNYLYLDTPISYFMIFYWSNLVNSYLTTKAMIDKYILLIINKEHKQYDSKSKWKNDDSIDIHRDVDRLMTNKTYLGYLKFNLSNNEKRLVLIFFNKYSFEYYNIFGGSIYPGYILSPTFLTAQEIAMLTYNKEKQAFLDKTNKDDDKHYIYWVSNNDPNIEIFKKNGVIVTDLFKQDKYKSNDASNSLLYNKLSTYKEDKQILELNGGYNSYITNKKKYIELKTF